MMSNAKPLCPSGRAVFFVPPSRAAVFAVRLGEGRFFPLLAKFIKSGQSTHESFLALFCRMLFLSMEMSVIIL
jgi:hypothetical protein